MRYMHYKKIIRQWKHKHKGNLPNQASKIKRLLARHDIPLPGKRASVKLHLWGMFCNAQVF